MINAAEAWSLGFAHPSWQLTKGEVVPIDLTFDNRSQFHLFGTVLTPNLVTVPMPNDSQLISQFRKSLKMEAMAQGQLFGFNLDTTSRLLPALAKCVVANRGGVVSNPAGAGPTNTSSPQNASASSDLYVEAVELATNFILKSQLQNPKVLSRAEMPVELASYGAVWKSDDAIGAVKSCLPKLT
jgi:hypothetical protein